MEPEEAKYVADEFNQPFFAMSVFFLPLFKQHGMNLARFQLMPLSYLTTMTLLPFLRILI